MQMALDSRGSIGRESIFIPERSRVEMAIAVLVLLASFAYLCLFRRYTSMDPDEGIILQGAQRILEGQVLYRDFFSFYTPGSYYLLALAFKIFGNSFIVARSILVLFGATLSVLHYLLAQRVCSRGTAFTIAVLVTATTLPYRCLVLHNWDSTLWAMLALYGAVRWLESGTGMWAFTTGSLAALTLMFEQSKGAGLCLGMLGGFSIIRLMNRQLLKPHVSAA